MAIRSGHHQDLRAGHVSKGITRELGRAVCLLVKQPEQGDRPVKSPGVVRLLPPRGEPETGHETKKAGQVSESETKAKRPETDRRKS